MGYQPGDEPLGGTTAREVARRMTAAGVDLSKYGLYQNGTIMDDEKKRSGPGKGAHSWSPEKLAAAGEKRRATCAAKRAARRIAADAGSPLVALVAEMEATHRQMNELTARMGLLAELGRRLAEEAA